MASKRLPPGTGALLGKTVLVNPFQTAFFTAIRQRFCLNCHTMGMMSGEDGLFVCAKCLHQHPTNLTAPHIFNRYGLFAGRRGGKTLGAAIAAREQTFRPNQTGFILGPTFKSLNDPLSTLETFCGLLDPTWIKSWDPEQMDLELVNGHRIGFRSLEDPERARGPGAHWVWMDEGAKCPHRGWKVAEPMLLENAGLGIISTTVLGFDWTYDEIERHALQFKTPGYWAARWRTIDNPLFSSNPVLRAEVERAQKTSDPDFFAQEYLGERRNFTGSVYKNDVLEAGYLKDDDAIKAFIPEWPNISSDRPVLIGLDSGADHPFGAVKIVVTPRGLVVVAEYLERMQAATQHLDKIAWKFTPQHYTQVQWAANRNEAQLRLEFGLRGVGVIAAEAKHEVGIQRVQSWLYSKKLKFAYTAPLTFEQMKKYRYAENIATDGQKRKEGVYKKNDELPDGLRYALMAWPELPEAVKAGDDENDRRMAAFDEKTRRQILDRIERRREEAEGEKLELKPEAFEAEGVLDWSVYETGGF